MFKYKHHLFVCINSRPPGHPKGDCQSKSSPDVVYALQEEIERRNLFSEVTVNGSTCLSPCQFGPTVVVYPDGVWYGNVTAADVPEIVEQHLVGGKPVERLLLTSILKAQGIPVP